MAITMEKMVYPVLWVLGVVISALCISGIANAQLPYSQHLFIVILVLTLFLAAVSVAAYCCKTKANYNYEVNEEAAKCEKASGKDNRAFQAEEGRANGDKASGGVQQKWVSNYVPYGEFPAGKNAPAVASTEDESKEAGASASTSNGVEAKWKKNYVPYKEEEDNKDKE